MICVLIFKLTFMSVVVNAIDSLSYSNQPCFIFSPYRVRAYPLGNHLCDLLISFFKNSSLRELFGCMSLREVLEMFLRFDHIHRNLSKQRPCLRFCQCTLTRNSCSMALRLFLIHQYQQEVLKGGTIRPVK